MCVDDLSSMDLSHFVCRFAGVVVWQQDLGQPTLSIAMGVAIPYAILIDRSTTLGDVSHDSRLRMCLISIADLQDLSCRT